MSDIIRKLIILTGRPRYSQSPQVVKNFVVDSRGCLLTSNNLSFTISKMCHHSRQLQTPRQIDDINYK